MNNSTSCSTGCFSYIRKILWPIEWHENKKFLPMAAMMFCILLNYSTLRSVKDGFVVTEIGPESISFLKTYVVLPSAILAMIIYVKLCNLLTQQKVFYTITTFFISFFALFAFILYPNPELVHPTQETVEAMIQNYPFFKWFIKIFACWDYALFYTCSELWGTMMLSLLFWQFANQITKTNEAKRFYSMFGLLANFSLPVTSLILAYFLNEQTQIVANHLKFVPILIIMIISGITVMILYAWMNKHVLTDPTLYDGADASKPKKSKVKLSLSESFKMILTSKYLGLIAILVICYGVSVNLVEGVWKAKISELHPTKEAYTMYMGQFQAYQGIAAILFMIVGSNILRKLSWNAAAIITPLMLLITGAAFFSFIIFDNVVAMHLTGLMTSGPLAAAVMIGMIQNVLSKATKYSLFDSTKEMSYIPLDDEMKSKGKAAVEVIGGRFGKSGGGIIQSTFFLVLQFDFPTATPYFAGIFFLTIAVWLFSVQVLGKEYNIKLAEQN